MSRLIFKGSLPCTTTEIEIFQIPDTQTAIEKKYEVEYHPISNIRDGGPVEFNISGNGEDFMDLANTVLHVKARITKDDGTALSVNEPVAPVNLFIQALFSQVDISLNERVISSSNNTYAYRAYLETLPNYGEDAKKSMLKSECFFKDENLAVVGLTLEKNGNPGLKNRYQLTKNSQTVDMIGPIHCDIFQQARALINMVDLKIKFTRSKPEFCLMSEVEKDKAEPNYKMTLEHASLFIRKVKLNPGVLLGQAKMLEKTTSKYPLNRVICKTYSISTGSKSFMQDNVFLGVMPKRIVIGLLENNAYTGKYDLNPFFFYHHKINFLSIYVDGQPVPSKPFELDFEANHYIRAYHRLFPGFNRDVVNFISREEFGNGHTLFAFDLSSDMCDGPHLNLQQQGNLRIEIKFAESLQKTTIVLVYAEFENIIEISKSRHVLCDFPN